MLIFQKKKKILKIKSKNLVADATKQKKKERPSTSYVDHSSSDTSNFDTNVNSVSQQIFTDGSIQVTRTQEEKDKNPDKICLDRKGLNTFPTIIAEDRLRLLSCQHNLINNLVSLQVQKFPVLVFLDLYNNQIDSMKNLISLETLRVLLIGKNRIKKIEGLENLTKLEVLDLHGNLINSVTGLETLSQLRVLNLAGNQLKCLQATEMGGLKSLQELNLRRNHLKRLSGLPEMCNLHKIFLSNNEMQLIEDLSNVIKSPNIIEISIENNPVLLNNDCVPFLVSYLPKLAIVNKMTINEQLRKASNIWRRNKETSNPLFMDLTETISKNVNREEAISNAKTNWELLRSQTKQITSNVSAKGKSSKVNPDADIILTSLLKSKVADHKKNEHGKWCKLPPILVPIINKIHEKKESVSSVCPNIDSTSSLLSSKSDSDSSSDEDIEEIKEIIEAYKPIEAVPVSSTQPDSTSAESSSTLSSNISSTSSKSNSDRTTTSSKRNIKSAVNHRLVHRVNASRSVSAKARKSNSNSNNATQVRDCEQGGDYLVEICGQNLNVYGQGSLHFLDKSWNTTKAHSVTTINFNYVNINNLAPILSKIKSRFPNADQFIFKETNIEFIGQINIFAEIQGLSSLKITTEGNPIIEKDWRTYAIYRLSHWGLKMLNDEAVSEKDIENANLQYQSLSDLVLCALPDIYLQPLLTRLSINIDDSSENVNPKVWLMSADAALRSVVSKEALQWKKQGSVQDEQIQRQKAHTYISKLLDEVCNSAKKLRMLDENWPKILHEIVRNTLLDYSNLDLYKKRKLLELM
ncbi:PREDICTED: leucine-rich repeat-containing protein 49 [Nicrophorus vespilloides]|uniref:Dynein axonemal assembly factor 1 homolog n=1 Tax=Nicrophorus vespilloides TaxID=110193 RepID=A0ABM1MAR8_NICVS|nr:PREDICTED: leucine-rich repeat-containing protein 49 [Nicrophorus vespilloides]